jgi:hypothetical protein
MGENRAHRGGCAVRSSPRIMPRTLAVTIADVARISVSILSLSSAVRIPDHADQLCRATSRPSPARPCLSAGVQEPFEFLNGTCKISSL